MKISIIGPCGGGKSTLARQIASKYNLKYVDLDEVFVDYEHITESRVPLFDKKKTSRDLRRVFKNPNWIMEGIYCVEDIFEEADMIVLISLPLWKGLMWQWKRFFTDYLERRRFGFKHNLILSQIILNQYFSQADCYERVGIKYPTMRLFKKVLKKYHHKSQIFPISKVEELFDRLELMI